MVSQGVGAAFAFSLGVLGCLNQHRVIDLVDLLRPRWARWQKVGVVGEVGMVGLWEAGAGRGRRGRWGVLRWQRRRWRWGWGEMGDTGEEGDERCDLDWHQWKKMKQQWNRNGCTLVQCCGGVVWRCRDAAISHAFPAERASRVSRQWRVCWTS